MISSTHTPASLAIHRSGQSRYSTSTTIPITRTGLPYPVSTSVGFPSPFPQDPSVASANGMFTSLEQAQADQSKTNPTYVDLTFASSTKGVTFTGNLVNCPTLPLGVEPPAIAFS